MAKKEQEYAKWVGVLPSMAVLWREVLRACTYLWLVGNGGMGYNCNYYYYHSSIPY